MKKEPEQPKLIKSEEKISFELQKSDRNRFRIKAETGIVRTFGLQEVYGYPETLEATTAIGFLTGDGSLHRSESCAVHFSNEEEALAWLVEQRGKFALKCLKQPDEKFTTIPILEKDDTKDTGTSDTPPTH